jgi:alanine racemase
MKPETLKLRSWAEINLAVLERNLENIRYHLPSHLRFISVVKANAYGHGLAPVVTRLMRARADAFAVAKLEEARQLQEIGSGWPVVVLSVLLPEEYPEAVRMQVIPVVSSLAEVQLLEAEASRQQTKLGVHLKIDTGMGRLGIWHEQASNLFPRLLHSQHLRLEGICTHFSSADSDPTFTDLQRTRFLHCLDELPPSHGHDLLVHADNSAGLESFPDGGAFNAVRVGLVQFGIRTNKGGLLKEARTEPVLSFHGRIGLVKDLPAGTPISYGQTHRLGRQARVAVVTTGYADGLSTAFSNRGKVIIHDQLCPVIGRVTMDQTLVDVTALVSRPEPGTRVTFIGKGEGVEITPSAYAAWSGQIEWEALCALSARTQRVYLRDSAL